MKSEFFQDGINLYNKNQLEKAKLKFGKEIVYNPKSELSYLYLSKIFHTRQKSSRGTKFENSNVIKS